ncbi:MAG: hypothetical protein KAY32_10395 [Candidatus Eisenbacteria sp.]|nr:hypothetical protein [Candidatus Eisenbacteria bacterium]
MAAERKYQNEARVYVAGQEIKDVYECFYTIRTEKSRSGLPTKNARPHRIHVIRRSEAETPGFFWSRDSQPKNFKSGKIEFYNTKGEIMKTFEWDKGYVARYREGVPDLTESERATMLEEYEICAEEFRCGDAEVHCHW